MSKKFICFILSAMLVLTFIPQITFAEDQDTEDYSVEENVDEMAEGDGITTEADSDAVPDTGVITGFVPLETSEYYFEGDPEEGELTISLPGYLSVYLDGSDQPADIPVTWESVEDFDNTDFYFYSMKPVWNEGIVLSDALDAPLDVPWITVYRQEPENEDIEPILSEDELDPIYTEEAGPVDPETGEPVETVDEITEDPADTDTVETVDEVTEDPADTSGFSLKAFARNAAGTVIDTVTEDAYADKASNTAAIYKYLTGTMGLNTAAACGVMININAESAMSPINLQNTYNSRFGLSDKAYTKAVDKGKGSYRARGASRNFKSDSGGYGLCQWTSKGRKTNLLKRALSKKKSIGDINMQLGFLETELKSYPAVLATLKNVPNNAVGAYIAAAEFCLVFEAPANTVSTAASRGRNCLSTYWKTYGSSDKGGSSYVSLCGYSYPTVIKKGKGMDVTGYAVSNCNVTSVTAKIINSSGKAVYSKTVRPNTTAYRLYGLDSAMKFAKLKPGNYTYTLSAKDSNGKTVKVSHKFKVDASIAATKKVLGFASAAKETKTTPAKPAQQTTPTKTAAKPAASTASKPAAKVKKAYPGNFPKLPKRGYFKKGDKGTQVKRLQKFLKWYGYKISVDGKCGKNTIKNVKKFQKAVGMKATGRFGKKTLAKAKAVKKVVKK